MSKLIGYYRVSTAAQGVSGLGLEAQQAAVADFARREGAEIVAHYTEVESGRKDDRPELARALAHCRFAGARLVIAKLDRLGRRLSFIATLMDSGVEFTACDCPKDRVMLHIRASLAEEEQRLISTRTKAALESLKARGVPLGGARPGSPPLAPEARYDGQRAGAEAMKRLAAQANAHVLPLVRDLAALGLGPRAIARQLNERGISTRRGKQWTHKQVANLLDRQPTTH